METARPTKVRLVEDGVPGTAARPVTKFRAALVRHIEVPALSRINGQPLRNRSGSLAILLADLAPRGHQTDDPPKHA